MTDIFSRAALRAYRLAGSLAYPAVGPYVGYRVTKGKEDPLRRRERYGQASVARPENGPVVWMHAASVGESMAIAPLAETIAADGIHVLMTTGTTTSAAMVAERLAGVAVHQYVPIDMQKCIRRFLDHWRPDLCIVAESEIWPTTMAELARRQVPQVLVNARLSDRSFKGWKAAPRLAESLFERFAHVIAQSEVDGERFRVLGAHAVTVVGNLKADVDPPPDPGEALAQISADITGRPCWAALSTHPGEEAMVAEAHRALVRQHPGLLTILVPRHVNRGDAIEAELFKAGLAVARRSRGERPEPGTDVLLGDTMGEMGLYLRLAGIAFLGKSITGEGGQNPLEAAMLDTAILSGRYVQNFRDPYLRLLKNGAARIVLDGDGLVDQVDRLLREPELRGSMANAGLRTVEEMRGALPRTLQALQPFLHPLRMSIGLERRGKPAWQS